MPNEGMTEDKGWSFSQIYSSLVNWYKGVVERRRQSREQAVRHSPIYKRDMAELKADYNKEIADSVKAARDAAVAERAGLLKANTGLEERLTSLGKALEASSASLLRARQEAEELRQGNELLSVQKSGLDAMVNSLQAKLGIQEGDIRMNAEMRQRQAEITEHIFSRLVMSERLVLNGTTSPVLFMDKNMRVTGINPSFTNDFGYTMEDLTEGLPLQPICGGKVEYNVMGVKAKEILVNPQVVDKLMALGNFFYPETRDDAHYELCLLLKPKRQQKRRLFGLLAPAAPKPDDNVMCMAYVTVATYDRQFLGASFEIREMSKDDKKKVAVDYIVNRDALVTAAERVTLADAEHYRRELLRLYTHDVTSASGRRNGEAMSEHEGIATIDLLATSKLEEDAARVFGQMYDFICSQEGRHIKLRIANACPEIRKQLFDAGIPAGIFHGEPKKQPAAKYNQGLEGAAAQPA